MVQECKDEVATTYSASVYYAALDTDGCPEPPAALVESMIDAAQSAMKAALRAKCAKKSCREGRCVVVIEKIEATAKKESDTNGCKVACKGTAKGRCTCE